MTLQRPAAALVLDGSRLTAAEAALTELQVELGLAGGHDRIRAALGLLSPAAGLEPGAPAEVGLGYGDDVETVLTGTVTAVERRPWGLVVEALAATEALSRTRVGRSYVSQTAAEVVEDLASSAGAETGEVSAPLQLAAYHVDERRSVWAHLRDLARLAGCELSAAPGGALNFRPPRSGRADHTLRHGAHVLAWSVARRPPPAPALAVAPFGAASEEGADRWHLLLREPDGGPPSGPTLVPAPLRDRDGAQALEDALGRTSERRAAAGTLVAVGAPSVRAGDLVGLEELPSGEDGTFRATSVTHLLGGASGFRTLLTLELAA